MSFVSFANVVKDAIFICLNNLKKKFVLFEFYYFPATEGNSFSRICTSVQEDSLLSCDVQKDDENGTIRRTWINIWFSMRRGVMAQCLKVTFQNLLRFLCRFSYHIIAGNLYVKKLAYHTILMNWTIFLLSNFSVILKSERFKRKVWWNLKERYSFRSESIDCRFLHAFEKF